MENMINEMKTMTMEEDNPLVSFDVMALFTNFPVEESILFAAETIYDARFEEPVVGKDFFINYVAQA